MKKGYLFFIVICLCVMCIPSVGLLHTGKNEVMEDGECVVVPSIREDDKWNAYYLRDMGEYFNENFAFRQEMISANAWIYGKVFHVSTTDQVLLGKNDWMYYTNTLNDYTATHLMSERGLNNVAHNIKLMQDFVEQNGSGFIFTIAPNKNSVYDENMPYYYQKGMNANNYERLVPKLETEGVHYVNLHEAFKNQDEVLYLHQDSHWNNKGAVLAYNRMMSQTDLDYETYENVDYTIKKNHAGDLATMVYPLNYKLEDNVSYQKDWQYKYYGEVTDNMDEFITTTSPKSNEVLLMYRDSFGESLLPFFADEFGVAYFSRLVPYNLNDIYTYKPNYVIIERVERRISSFAEQAAVMDLPKVETSLEDSRVVFDKSWEDLLSQKTQSDEGTKVNVKQNGAYYQIQGTIDKKQMTDNTKIYITLVTKNDKITYETFWISKQEENGVNDNGFAAYFQSDRIPDDLVDLQIIVK